ncbi:MAG TPA: MYXO-CTERM sorting domain-containing protein [Polyangia bacterium]|nr:MYXO-CTERM sorting domain-containing protein [Polyangia bacterium]
MSVRLFVGPRLFVSLLLASAGWLLPVASARANGAFPDSLNIVTPDSLPDDIFLATNFGLVTSIDDGQTWTYACEQTQNNFATLYQAGPPPTNRIFATSLAGFIYTDDQSCSWSVGGGAASGTTVSDLFPDPTNANRVLAVVAIAVDAGISYQVLQSSDGGATFAAQPLYTAAGGDDISGVEISRSSPTTIYLTLTSGTTHAPKIAQSTNNGTSWQLHDLTTHLPPGTNFIRLIAVDPTNPQKVFLRIRSPGDGGTMEGVAVTTDGGTTASTPLSFPGGILSAFTRMASGTIVLGGVVGTTNVAYTSTDDGVTFQPINTPQPSFRALSSRGSSLFVVADNAADGYAVGISTDVGKTWTPIMAYEDIQAITTCLQTYCQTDCMTRAGAGQWALAICSATAMPLPVDAGADAGPIIVVHDAGAAGHGGGGTTGAGNTTGGKSSNGCHCATAPAGRPNWPALAGLGLALALVVARRRR